ncbi:50S ribosomal protein L35 [Jatrophihabitans endophyticus]|uniref:large ribosomal subunit protein bL35 n=1 Tax=Jatrophihabitans endophyticus TaxID=1206085 RepID=UPI001A0D1124|nr:50S ribosomal protein L35 [Jatrophihabitans endophyticus]MBE7189115.1 50S ribosomal protein L35 [Jatrophihabitans endophyticus]
MPKFKTNKAAAARFKVTKSGKVRRERAHRKAGAAFASPPLRGRGYRRSHTGTTDVAPADVRRVKRMLGR